MGLENRNIVHPGQFRALVSNLLDMVAPMKKDADGKWVPDCVITDDEGHIVPDPKACELTAAEVGAYMVWGAAGVGKSSMVKALAEEHHLGFKDIRLAQMESIDIRGLPVPDIQKHMVSWLPNAAWPTSEEGGILFLDELSAAPKDVQVAAYELILDRQLGGGEIYKLPPRWVVIAAGNRACDGAVAMKMSSALANRCTHFEMEPDSEEWVAWAMHEDLHPAVTSFIKFKPELLHRTDKENLERGFPTPRSWAKVSSLCKLYKDEGLLRSAVYGAVGIPAGTEFIEHYKLSAQMDNVLDLMLDETRKVNIPKRDDLKWAMTSAMVYHAWRGKDKEDQAARINGFMRIAAQLPPSFGMAAMTAIRQGTKNIDRSTASLTIMRSKYWKLWRDKFNAQVNEDYELK